MKEFWMTLIGTSLLAGAVGILVPKAHKKYLRLLTGLCLLCVMAEPMMTLAQDGLPFLENGENVQEEVLSNYDEIYNQTLLHADASYLSSFIKTHICQEISAKDDDVSVTVSFEEQEGKSVLKRTTVLLRGSAVVQDPYGIVEAVENLTGAPCSIVYS